MVIKKGDGVLVTTDKRGVFFGYATKDIDVLPGTIDLTDARNCVYWSKETRGVLGLASDGPLADCKIGPKVGLLKLNGVTSVALASDGAIAKWEAEPWG